MENMITGNDRRTRKKITLPDGAEQIAYIAGNPENLNCSGFLTLTIGDGGAGKFKQVFDAVEASRRFNNLNRNFLRKIFERAVVVTERHKNGAVHFHLVGILAGRPDIRTGFDFSEFKRLRKSGRKFSAADVGASPELAALWKKLRDNLPDYGFGRAELTPIEKTGEAVACYVSKYIEKNICNRLVGDKRKKLVRYIGFRKSQLKPNEFSWGTKRATAWRCKARAMAGLVNITERSEMSVNLGPRWAHFVTSLWQRVTGDDLQPFLVADFHQTELLRASLVKKIGCHVARRLDDAQIYRCSAAFRDMEADLQCGNWKPKTPEKPAIPNLENERRDYWLKYRQRRDVVNYSFLSRYRLNKAVAALNYS